MTNTPRQWQTTIWVGNPEQPMTLYGATLAQLSATARDSLMEQQPQHFANLPLEVSTHITYTKKSSKDLQHLDEVLDSPKASSDSRWMRTDPRDGHGWPEYDTLSLAEAVARFTTGDICIERGPDYQEVTVQDGVLQLHRIKAVRLESTVQGKNIPHLNLLLRRDWYVLKIEEREGDYQLLLGHAEADAF